MKIKISIVLFILISMLNMGAVCNFRTDYSKFEYLEIYMQSKSYFVENGIKLQYKVNNNINNESSRIKTYLEKNKSGYYSVNGENQFDFVNVDLDINVKLWNKDNYTYVEIILINKNSQYNSLDLKQFLKGLEETKDKEIKYFFYYKGKLKDCDTKSRENLLLESNIKNIDMININNGYTGVGEFTNGEKINFALADYNTGYYIIIGTPIIFTAY